MYAAADGGGSSNEFAIQVKPEELLAGAAKFEEAADAAGAWLVQNALKLKFKPMGLDGVSERLSSGLGENADGVLGATSAVTTAIEQLTAAAAQMRATAAQYGITEENNTADVAAQGSSL